ncbi:MAG: DUF4147 domain-containing protein [Chitinophagaceae bacterium]|nr:DUF4147 domain-containing protein [Chitinophagaceae bacterium]
MLKDHALEIYDAAIKAVQPQWLLPSYIKLYRSELILGQQRFSLNEIQSIFLLSVGKAAAAMAQEAEKILGERISDSLVITKYGHNLPLKNSRSIEAGHPVPDENSIRAGDEVRKLLQAKHENDIVIALISGGASALMSDFPPGCSLKELQQLNQLLLQAGADIKEINTVRKHVSLLKGGQLTKLACPATVVAFLLSDVSGDPLGIIASGPTVADHSTFQDAWHILEKYNLTDKTGNGIRQWLQKGVQNKIDEIPKPGDKIFDKTFNYLIGSNVIALKAAEAKARELGYYCRILNDKMQGEAKEEAVKFIQQLIGYNGAKPVCILMGGETTVTIKGKGRGGRNQEFVLAALCEMMNLSPFKPAPVVLSAGTDGTDGPTDATGAVADAGLIQKIKDKRIDPIVFLNNNDSYSFFKQAGGHIITGPTHTNVMDVVIGLIP